MVKLREKLAAARAFVVDVVNETKKTDWPDREELISSTVVVIVSSVLLSVFVGVFDKILHWILQTLLYRS